MTELSKKECRSKETNTLHDLYHTPYTNMRESAKDLYDENHKPTAIT